MKFLCLHGAIGNPENFKVQLDPLVKDLESDGTCGFHFAKGKVPSPPPPGFEEYFGPGPHYRFMDDEGAAAEAMIESVRDLPEADSPEECMRELVRSSGNKRLTPPKSTLQPLYDILDADEEIEGIIGYSEGAVAAGTLLLDEQRMYQETGRPRRLKCSLFFGGWPAVDAHGDLYLADEQDDIIDVPSVHVIGASDPFIAGSMALYNAFDEDTAQLFDHGKGHTLPRDPRTLKELAKAIRNLINTSDCETASSSDDSSSEADFSD